MSIKQELGKKIKIIRKNRKLTQEQLAEKTDISPRAISGIELGTYYPKAETLDKIIRALDTTSEELFANECLKSSDKLIKDINKNIEKIKKEEKKLQLLHKIVKALASE